MLKCRWAWWSKHFESFQAVRAQGKGPVVNTLWYQADFLMLQPLFVQTQEEQAEIMKYGNPREKGKLQRLSRPNWKKGQELWRSDRKGSTDRELLSTTSETVFLFHFLHSDYRDQQLKHVTELESTDRQKCCLCSGYSLTVSRAQPHSC